MIDFTDIDKNLPNGENMGGITQKVYFGYHADVATFPPKPVEPLTLETAAVLTGDLTMKTGTYSGDTRSRFPVIPVHCLLKNSRQI